MPPGADARGASIYLCPTEHCPHLLQFAVGMLEPLGAQHASVGVFRPIVAEPDDPVLAALLEQVDDDGAKPRWGATADEVLHNSTAAMAQIIARFAECAEAHEAVLVLGSEYDCSLAPIEFAWNTRVAANLDVPMVLVVPSGGGAELTRERIDVALDEATRNFAQVVGVLAPRSEGQDLTAQALGDLPVPAFVVAEVTGAVNGLDGALAAIGAEPVAGAGDLTAVAPRRSLLIADMSLTNLLPQVRAESLVIFSADRAEIGVGVPLAAATGRFPAPAAAIAAGPWPLDPAVGTFWQRLTPQAPLLRTRRTIEQVYLALGDYERVPAQLDARQVRQAREFFARDADAEQLLRGARTLGRADVVTPLMFEHRLLEAARAADRHIVLPEGEEERIIRAAHRLLDQGICRITLLGDPSVIRRTAQELDLNIAAAHLIDPADSPLRERFAQSYAQLRAKKGVTLEQARETMSDPSYFGTMMVHESLADGMVSGAVNTTAHTIRPALQIIRTVPGISVVSSVFLMCLADRVLVFGDCAVNPNPTPEQVAEIAISSAETARQFGIHPRVAMLSYSTGTSGSGPDVEQTIEATRLVREKAPDLAVDGPLQYDAAVEPSVARTKAPGSPVAGRATVLIFPDLQTGNNTYKAVQRSAGALAIGPVLQGLNRPVNDLSRGALVSDIVNTVAITAIQAGR
ncbi:phosphate acetyltransferase [Tessaracoccus lubricantis]|uniref:Phosphate acetyltransferase n=1 Tax=Tessaracoccus lubricantis TaxID=545543 RepID=A0ABP9FQ56_9ACTN